MELPELFKMLSDPNRLRILALLGGRTSCVCDLEAVLQVNQSNLSRHLAKLREAGLVQASKRGMFVYYELKAPDDPDLKKVLEHLYPALHDLPYFEQDRACLETYLASKPVSDCP